MIEFAGVLLLRRKRMTLLTEKQKSIKIAQIGSANIMQEICVREHIKSNDLDSMDYDKKDASLVERPPVGYSLNEDRNGEPSRDHSINGYDINQNEETSPLGTVSISTTKIDAIASMIYFLAFFLFNFICLLLYLNAKEMPSMGTKNIGLLCACEHIDGGINSAWNYLSEAAKKICQK